MSTLLLYNISKTTTPFVNAAVNEALQQLVPIFARKHKLFTSKEEKLRNNGVTT